MVSDKVLSAIDFAYKCHMNQQDKAGKPYFGHVLRVAMDVFHLGEDYFIVALLHDVCEDCGINISYIEENYGAEIAEAVASVTRNDGEQYSKFIERASKNIIGKIVKMADLKDNSRPERIACLPIENQSIIKRYQTAMKFLEEN